MRKPMRRPFITRGARSLLAVVFVVLLAPTSAWSEPEESGGGPAPHVGKGPDITEEQRREIQDRLDRNAEVLRELGLLPEAPQSLVASHAILDWPLRAPKLYDPGYHAVWYFVDQNPGFPNSLLDYSCGNRTYDTAEGYNHQGTDFGVWPFAWLRQEEDKVEVVAAADGIILGKDDGHPDHSCVNDPSLPWNAVYLRHADGSRTWYGHLQNGSPTPKVPGSTVARGEYLGLMGSSGNSRAPHLHFEVYDSSGFLNDPYQGACNGMNATSWWSNQRPYSDSALNRVATGFGTPVFPPCPEPEDTNEAVDFNPGDRAVFLSYFRDLLAGQVSTSSIRRPDGTLFATWTDSATQPFDDAWYFYRLYASFAPSGPLGVWRYDVSFLGKTYSRRFRLAAVTGSGRVPGEFPDEVPLLLTRSASDIALAWDASCVSTDTDYEVYEGEIGSWSSHAPKLCSTGGSTTATITPAAGSSYYLVVPTDTAIEGSYGLNGTFAERPVGASSCHAQIVGGNCARCGDLLLQPPEVCDRNLLNGQTCQSLGFADGTLLCAPDCQSFDTSACF
jgi:murein DD-endopeptidase MepM/ murein hydrolase activator NlpD